MDADANRWSDLDRPPLRVRDLRRALTIAPPGAPEPAWRAIEVVTETGSTNADLAAPGPDG